MPKLKLISSAIFAILMIPSVCFAGLIIGDYNVLPATLPEGFEPLSGTKSPDGATYVIAGAFNNRPAYLNITRDPNGVAQLTSVQVLPSLMVAAGGVSAGGAVRDVYFNEAGQLEYVGYSDNETLNPALGLGEGTVWNASGTPTGLGLLPGGTQSPALKGSRNGLYVGESAGNATLFSQNSDPIRLSNAAFGIALGISKDGTVIGGRSETSLAYWTADVVGVSYTEHTVDIPAGGFNNGSIFGVEGDWLVGMYFSETLLDYAAAIWSSEDGSLINDLAAFGSVTSAVVEIVDGVRIAGFNTTPDGDGPFLYIEGEPGIITLASLFHDLAPEMGAIAQLVDIFPGTLSVLALTTTGQYVFSSFHTSGGNSVPEPGTLLLFGSAISGLALRRKRTL